jgi:hypothetical protein
MLTARDITKKKLVIWIWRLIWNNPNGCAGWPSAPFLFSDFFFQEHIDSLSQIIQKECFSSLAREERFTLSGVSNYPHFVINVDVLSYEPFTIFIIRLSDLKCPLYLVYDVSVSVVCDVIVGDNEANIHYSSSYLVYDVSASVVCDVFFDDEANAWRHALYVIVPGVWRQRIGSLWRFLW